MTPTAPSDVAAFRCAAASTALGESPAGTASTVRAFVVLEAPGPWGIDALRDSRLPVEVKGRLRSLEREHGIRPLLARRHTRAGSGSRLFAAYAGDPAAPVGTRTHSPGLYATALGDVRDVLDLDLSGLAAHAVPDDLRPHEDPVFCVCTHGKHDACCAERGRPLAAALAQAAPEHTWEVSHIGGDRFAPNVLVLPHGLYYGRLSLPRAAGWVQRHHEGRLDLDHLRGRSSYSFPTQAAEIALRQRLGDDRLAAYPLLGLRRTREADGTVHTEVTFEAAGVGWQARVQTTPGVPGRLTCRSVQDSPPPRHDVVELRPLDAAR